MPLLLNINTWLLGAQDSNHPSYDMMLFFYDLTMTILIAITVIITLTIFMLVYNKLTNRYLLHGHVLELLWTMAPMLVLLIIALPSLKVLYITDEVHHSSMTIKALGHQWYWSYEYSDFYNVGFDSFMIPPDQLKPFEFRLLDVDNRCILPYMTPIRVLTTSTDVIHSWAVPSLGIKMDSTPGRLNQTILTMNRPGLYYGQCSEICGINHSFMPIVIESTNPDNFMKWLLLFDSNY